jgi:hypothetical protein
MVLVVQPRASRMLSKYQISCNSKFPVLNFSYRLFVYFCFVLVAVGMDLRASPSLGRRSTPCSASSLWLGRLLHRKPPLCVSKDHLPFLSLHSGFIFPLSSNLIVVHGPQGVRWVHTSDISVSLPRVWRSLHPPLLPNGCSAIHLFTRWPSEDWFPYSDLFSVNSMVSLHCSFNVFITLARYHFLLFCFFCGIGVWTQGFVLVKQVFYHLSQISSPSYTLLVPKVEIFVKSYPGAGGSHL